MNANIVSGLPGNTFRPQDIERAQSFEYDPDFINENSDRTIGLDPASSSFGIVVTDFRDGKPCVLLAEEHKRSGPEMVPYVLELMQKYKPIAKVYVDGSQVLFIKMLKDAYGEEVDYQAAKKRCEQQKMSYEKNYTIIDVAMNAKNNINMLYRLQTIMQCGFLMIHPRFSLLINALHSCSDERGTVNKNFVGNDAFDSLRLCMQNYDL